jgi:AcrR family transcriptional regulator
MTYPGLIPKLWQETIEAHRREVHDAILDTAAALVARQGLRSVTMSQIAHETGIGRATLYKYFSGVEPILIAWHERHVTQHLDHLRQLRNQAGEPGARLEAVLHAFARIAFERHRHGTDLRALVHQAEHMAQPQRLLTTIISELLAEASTVGVVRTDVRPDELATFCLHALEGAADLPDESAVARLVRLVLDGVRPSD